MSYSDGGIDDADVGVAVIDAAIDGPMLGPIEGALRAAIAADKAQAVRDQDTTWQAHDLERDAEVARWQHEAHVLVQAIKSIALTAGVDDVPNGDGWAERTAAAVNAAITRTKSQLDEVEAAAFIRGRDAVRKYPDGWGLMSRPTPDEARRLIDAAIAGYWDRPEHVGPADLPHKHDHPAIAALLRALGVEARTARVLVHADGGACHGTPIIDGRCPKCGIAPDTQSLGLWPTFDVTACKRCHGDGFAACACETLAAGAGALRMSRDDLVAEVRRVFPRESPAGDALRTEMARIAEHRSDDPLDAGVISDMDQPIALLPAEYDRVVALLDAPGEPTEAMQALFAASARQPVAGWGVDSDGIRYLDAGWLSAQVEPTGAWEVYVETIINDIDAILDGLEGTPEAAQLAAEDAIREITTAALRIVSP